MLKRLPEPESQRITKLKPTEVAKSGRTLKTEEEMSFPKDKPISAVTMARWTLWQTARRETRRITPAGCCQGDFSGTAQQRGKVLQY